MPLTEQQQKLIREAHEAGRRPNRQGSGRISLPLGGTRYTILGNQRGLSEAGEYYRTLAGENQGPQGLGADRIVRLNNGNREFLQPRNGQRVLLRYMNPRGEWDYTRKGLAYFSKHEYSEFVVSIPVRIRTHEPGHRQEGRERHDYLPWTMFGDNVLRSQVGTRQEREEGVKAEIMARLEIRRPGDIIMTLSGETHYLDDRPWQITEMATRPNPEGGQPTTTVSHRALAAPAPARLRQVDRPMGHRGAASHLPFPDDVLPEAFEQHADRLCVPRQLCKLLGCKFEDLCGEFDYFLEGYAWRDVGVTSTQLMDFLRDRGVPFHCWADQQHYTWTCAEPQGPQIAWTVHDDHMFAYRHGRALEKHRTEQVPTTALRAEHQGEMPPFDEWRPWDGEPSPGYFHCPCLRSARMQLLASGRTPKLSLKSLGCWAALRYRCTVQVDGQAGWCVIRELPAEHGLFQWWCETLGVEYRGQNLPGLTLEVFEHLLRGRRKQPTLAQRRQIVAEQEGKCALCGEEGQLEFDHQPPVRQVLAGQPQEFRGLCRHCHQEVTEAQGGTIRLESRFSKPAWRDYVMSPRAPPLIWQPEKPGEDLPVCEVDVIRCRRNALMHPAVAEWPVFCALDSIRPQVTQELSDFSFVTGVRDRRKSRMSVLPYVGQMWYARPSVEFMLHHGIIGWQDISHTFSASGRVRVDLAPVLEKMEEAWTEEGRRLKLPKLSINQMIGVWAIQPGTETLYVVSGGVADGLNSWGRQDFQYGENTVIDWIHRIGMVDNASWRPIHDIVMSTEHVAMAHLRYVISRLSCPCAVLDVKTDAFQLQVAPKHLNRVLSAVADIKFSDLHTLTQRKQRPLHDACEMQPRPGEGRVYRFSPEGRRLQGVYRPPIKDAETPTCPQGWVELTEAEARARILAGGSLMVEGLPGTGKSYAIAQVCAELERLGRRLCVICKTHAQVANFNAHLTHFLSQVRAITADHWAHAYVRRGHCPFDCVVVEEASMIDSRLWNEVAKASFLVPQWVILGDWFQFRPVCDTWAGTPVTLEAGRSHLIWDLAGGHRWVPTENRRSDPVLFEFVKGVLSSDTLPDLLAAARAQFPLRPGPAGTACPWRTPPGCGSTGRPTSESACSTRRQCGMQPSRPGATTPRSPCGSGPGSS